MIFPFVSLVTTWKLICPIESVLVVEAGEFVDSDATKIPYKANDLTSANGLMWDGIVSTPEPGLGNNSYPVIVAKVLGGGSVINGKYSKS